MFIFRKAREASRAGVYFTSEKTGLEFSFYKISQMEIRAFGSESSAPSLLEHLTSTWMMPLFYRVASVVRKAGTGIPLIHKMGKVHLSTSPVHFPSAKPRTLGANCWCHLVILRWAGSGGGLVSRLRSLHFASVTCTFLFRC